LDVKREELVILDEVIDLETVWGAACGSSSNYSIVRRHWWECGENMTWRAEPFISFKEMIWGA
jgi:hypothetical protein